MKSIAVFAIVIVALSVTGYWLHDGGWLEVPRVFDIPAVLGGQQNAGMQRQPAGESAGERPTPDQTGGMPQGGPDGAERHGENGGGLNWDALPGVLANLWIIAFIITVVAYSSKLLGIVTRQIRVQRASVSSA